MAARAGVEPATLRLKAIDSINVPPRPTICINILVAMVLPMVSLSLLLCHCCYGYSSIAASSSRLASVRKMLQSWLRSIVTLTEPVSSTMLTLLMTLKHLERLWSRRRPRICHGFGTLETTCHAKYVYANVGVQYSINNVVEQLLVLNSYKC